MTTIIADGRVGLMGADTHTDYGVRVCKIWRHKTKGLFGCAGDDTAIARFEDWILRGKRKPDQIINTGVGGEDFFAVQMLGGKIYVWDTSMRPDVSIRVYHGIGSGSPWALGAMDHGATLHEALTIASERDSGTKPPFTFLEV